MRGGAIMFLLFLLFASIVFLGIKCQRYSYDANDENGPAYWGKSYRGCYGKQQSPIYIKNAQLAGNINKDFVFFYNLDAPLGNVNVKHTLFKIGIEIENDIYLEKGCDSYQLDDIHFHWGENSSCGSEHLFENKKFAMEAHFVFHNKKYENLAEAKQHTDGLTVLAFFYLPGAHNKYYKKLTRFLPIIKEPNWSAQIEMSTSLNQLTNGIVKTKEYVTYRGSLTTPPCYESVQWILYAHKYIYLSEKQLEAFRNAVDENGRKIRKNYRPTQPLNNRTIYLVN